MILAHLGIFGLSIAFKFVEVWYIQSVEARRALQVSGTALLAAGLGLGPAIWATQQPDQQPAGPARLYWDRRWGHIYG